MEKQEMTLLNVVRKTRAGQLAFPAKKTQAIKEGTPYWTWAENGEVIASEAKPEGVPGAHCRELMRYGRKKDIRAKAGIVMPVPLPVAQSAGMKEDEWVTVSEGRNRIVIAKATDEQVALVKRSGNKPAADGEVRGGRYYRFTPEARKKLGIKNGDRLMLTVNGADGVWMEIRKAPQGCETGGVRDVFYHDYGRYLKGEPMEFTVTTKYADQIALPTYFLNKAGVPGADVESMQLPCWYSGNTLILEGLPQQCAACGREHRTYRNKMAGIEACHACMCELEVSRRAYERYGSLEAALDDPASELARFAVRVIHGAVRANSYLKEKLEGIAR